MVFFGASERVLRVRAYQLRGGDSAAYMKVEQSDHAFLRWPLATLIYIICIVLGSAPEAPKGDVNRRTAHT